MRTNGVALLLVCSSISLSSSHALAEEAGEWSGSVDLVSDYVFRGISQNNRDVALQAGIEYQHHGGFYAGVWGSNVSWLSDGTDDVSNSLEFDGHIGWRCEFDSGIGLDIGVVQYYYPGDYPAGFTRPHTTEPYVGLGYGGFKFGYAHSVTNLFGIDDSKNSGYLSFAYEHEFDRGWSLGAAIGRQRIANAGDASYTDWSVAVGKELAAGFSIGLSYVDTNADEALYSNVFGEKLADAAVVLSVSVSF